MHGSRWALSIIRMGTPIPSHLRDPQRVSIERSRLSPEAARGLALSKGRHRLVTQLRQLHQERRRTWYTLCAVFVILSALLSWTTYHRADIPALAFFLVIGFIGLCFITVLMVRIRNLRELQRATWDRLGGMDRLLESHRRQRPGP